jgi:fibro-slime domain-containing protein
MKTTSLLKAGSTVGLFSVAAVIGASLDPKPALGEGTGGSSTPPSTIYLTGVVRDFREYTVQGGHPDFERTPAGGFAMYVNNVAVNLGADTKPVFTGGGRKVGTQWKDSSGRQICPCLYNSLMHDTAGAYSGGVDTGGVQSADTFNQWFRDVPGINMSAPLTLTFKRVVVSGKASYVFDDKTDPAFMALGGFFPIEHQLFSNPGGTPDRNFHFTYELHTEFTYDSAANQVFKFIGDDDVFVFINNKKVIDLGGVHSAQNQVVDLNRLNLTSGHRYTLDFFFAERHRTQSNCRIETNLLLESVQLPTVSVAYD